ncbi:MAG: hypothetical protein J7K04_08435 [Spirochaetales bacterium]|nr:hypothetical protein [Spirochaetales bacterium]
MGMESVNDVPPPANKYEDRVQKPEPEKPADSTNQAESTPVQQPTPNDDVDSTIKEITPQDDDAGKNVDLLA